MSGIGSHGPLAIGRIATLRVVRFYLLLGFAWIVVTDGVVFLHGGVSLLPAMLGMGKGLFFVAVTGVALYFYMTRRAHETRHENEALRQRLTQLSKFANDIVLLFDESGKIIEANDRAVDAYGYPLDVLLAMNVEELRQSSNEWHADWATVIKSGEARFEAVHQRADGSVFPIEVSSRRIDHRGRHLVQSIVRDIGERKEAERKIIRLKDIYAALSQTNQEIVRTSNREELFKAICGIAVKFGHFRLAWVGMVDEATQAIVPVAMAGPEIGYLDGVRVSADPASPFSKGPTGLTVIRGEHFIANDLNEQMRGTPWQDHWTRFDIKSAAAFPMFFQGRAVGSLTLYSSEVAFFSEDLIDLLDEMAVDISYAMDRIEADRQRLNLEAELVATNARIQGILAGTQDIVAAIDRDLRITLCNRTHRELLESQFGIEMISGKSIEEWAAHPSLQVRSVAASLRKALDGEYKIENWSFTQGEEEVFYESFMAPLFDPLGEMIGAFHVGRDVSEHRKMESELRKLTTAVEQSPVTVVITDLNGSIQYVNPFFTVTTGYEAAEVLGKNSRILSSGETSHDQYQAMWECIQGGSPWFGLFHNRRKDGSLFWEEAIISPVRDAAGVIKQYIAIKQDITLRLEAEERASFLTFHDQLTSLPNRVLVKTYMETAKEDAEQSGGKSALLSVDVDNFKRINDSLGYHIGDRLLQTVAERIQGCLRSTDTLSRAGGDEFLIVLSAVTDEGEIGQMATAILNRTRSAFAVEGFELSVTLSIGIAVYPDDSLEFEALHRQASMAMYVAKRSGRNAYRFYTSKMETDANEYMLILNGLRMALERNEFVLHYQPQYCIETGEIVGAEALLRWNHPQLGLIPPVRFIPIAEDSGLIVDIGEWVLQEACREAVKWQREGQRKLVVAVNLSAVQFKRAGLPELVRRAFAEAGLEPCCLSLELTESILIENTANVLAIVKQLKALGVALSLDDFGTGYASFAYLRNFDLDELKIDQSFIHEIATNPGDEKIVKSIIELAKCFGLRTVAEGVEDAMALDLVRAAGCDYAQGYYFARPMPAEQMSALIASRPGNDHGRNADSARDSASNGTVASG
jgi:diguanylate cyclase (GGDEF)-like protein/PAS domain S-box-containing protein